VRSPHTSLDSPLSDPEFRTKAIRQFIENPSLGALTYQACFLIDELSLITGTAYPPDARHIRDIFLSWVEYLRDELWDMYDPDEPLGIKQHGDFRRVRGLGKLLHQIHSNLRYVLGASLDASPIGLQAAVAELTTLYFPAESGTYACIVRPQWKYNLKYVPLSNNLRETATQTLIDPQSKLRISEDNDVFSALWTRRRDKMRPRKKKRLPVYPARHLAILSFPGLDRKDSLLYPLIAHEIGHFIDLSCTPPLHTQGLLTVSGKIELDEVRASIAPFYGNLDAALLARRLDQAWNLVSECALTCLRELLADLLATRMMGLSFFISQAEFLKTVGDWELHFIEGQPLIDLKSGYPNIRLRLSVIYHHLIKDNAAANLLQFIDESLTNRADLHSFLAEYITEWRRLLEPPEIIIERGIEVGENTIKRELSKLVEVAVLHSLSELEGVARSAIPDEKRAILTPTFLQRFDRLINGQPPICRGEASTNFAEILSAAWVYQLFYGEWKEIKHDNIEDQKKQYLQTCALVNKSLEALNSAQKLRA